MMEEDAAIGNGSTGSSVNVNGLVGKDGGWIEAIDDVEEPLLLPSEQRRNISVVAPANMDEGYTFEASVDGRMFIVIVPDGGALVGETIITHYPQEEEFLDFSANPHFIPKGYWRDGLFDITAHGKVHATIFCGFLCPPILMAQVLTRFWKSSNNSSSSEGDGLMSEVSTKNNEVSCYQKLSPFQRIVSLVAVLGTAFLCLKIMFCYVALRAWAALPDADELQKSKHLERVIVDIFFSTWGMVRKLDPLTTVIFIIQTFAIVFTLCLICKTRHRIRNQYDIPPATKCDNACDDCLISTACCCCTAAQIARHTANYSLYEATLFTSTGLTPDSPPLTGGPISTPQNMKDDDSSLTPHN